MGKKGKKRWSYRAGRHGHACRVYERTDKPYIYLAIWDPAAAGGKGGERKRSLGHSDRRRAMEQADKLVAEYEKLRADPPAVGRVFGLYATNRSIDKGAAQRQEDERQRELWTTVLGADYDLSDLSVGEWDAFVRDRRSGRIDGRGRRVSKPVPVAPRTAAKDLKALRAVTRWACTYRVAGRKLLDSDPTAGLSLPIEQNPRRPLATHDRVDRIREHYHKPTMRVERDGRRERVESYLPEIFDVVVGTGRRISAVCKLRVEDLDLGQVKHAPYGRITWPGETDKMGKTWSCPISGATRDALERALVKRGQVGKGPLFPAPRDRSVPARYEQATVWLREAEKQAELEPQQGGAWHPYRRLWATARKWQPTADTALAGGWKSTQALEAAYIQADDETLYRVVSNEREIREAR